MQIIVYILLTIFLEFSNLHWVLLLHCLDLKCLVHGVHETVPKKENKYNWNVFITTKIPLR